MPFHVYAQGFIRAKRCAERTAEAAFCRIARYYAG
jgi:hypothetical protein